MPRVPPARQSAARRSPAGYGAKDAAIAGSRCAAVTIGSASAPSGAGDAGQPAQRLLQRAVLVAGDNGQGRLRHGKC